MCRKIFVSWVILSLFVLAVSAADEILLVTEEWAPYNYTEAGELTGFSTEIVQNILDVLKENYEIRLLPSMRASNLLNTRPHTMMFSMFRIPERETLYQWIGPLSDASIFFYKRKGDSRRFTSLEDMKQVVRIACRHAGLIPTLLLEQGFSNLDMTATSSLPVYQKLLHGRCDLAISDADLGVRYQLKSLDVKLDEVFEKIPIPVFEAELYIACSKDIPEAEIQRWNSALDTLKINGVYGQILQKYH